MCNWEVILLKVIPLKADNNGEVIPAAWNEPVLVLHHE